MLRTDIDNRFWCAYGTQNPVAAKNSLSITCEINPTKGGKARCAGLFLRDPRGALYLGHTGRVGGGGKGVSKEAFLAFYRTPPEPIDWPDGRSTPYLVVGKISSPTFRSDLAKFIFSVERFKEKIKSTQDIDEQLRRDAEKAERLGQFIPKNVAESREKIVREVNLRRGQPNFRKEMLKAYAGRCAICGCDCVDTLEAAHILPYGGADTNHVQNGILLRSDLHTLFDLGKVGVVPQTHKVIVARSLMNTVYAKLNGKKVRLPAQRANWPNEEVLRDHLDRWRLK